MDNPVPFPRIDGSRCADIAIELIHRPVMEGRLDSREYRDMHIHIIEANDAMMPLSVSSTLNTEWEFVILLRDIGRRTAGAWIDRHFGPIGERSTADLASMCHGSCVKALT